MKRKWLTLTLFVVSLARLHGRDRVTSYLPTLVEGAGILEVTETYAPSGGSGYINKTLVRSSDTASMRKYMTAEMAYQLAESDRYEALQIEARAKHDSLYAALEVLNEGLGAVDGPEPLREPSRPDDGPVFRWGAVLPEGQNMANSLDVPNHCMAISPQMQWYLNRLTLGQGGGAAEGRD